ncbi:MAG: carbonic anhydrase [Alphaproteobacteria bacterium]
MKDIAALVDGYRAFRSESYQRHRQLYESLATSRQPARTMIVGCCDSRVDPATIFNAGPGELFVVRNVANLVPPYEPQGLYHGTSAALEFAVTGLGVEHIVVLGHARCGGIKALLDALHEPDTEGRFVTSWMSIVRGASSVVVRANAGAPPEVRQRALEHASITCSLDNLRTFPFVRERITAKALDLHGAYFDIATGQLEALDEATGTYSPVV